MPTKPEPLSDEMELRQMFQNKSDCYADTWKSERGIMTEGDVIQAMTEDRFVEVMLPRLNALQKRVQELGNRLVDFERVSRIISENKKLQERVQELERENEWISVGDRLPETNKPLIGYDDDGEHVVMIENENSGFVWAYDSKNNRPVIAVLREKIGWCEDSSFGSNGVVEISHWKPILNLPQPPKTKA